MGDHRGKDAALQLRMAAKRRKKEQKNEAMKSHVLECTERNIPLSHLGFFPSFPSFGHPPPA